MAAIRLVAQFRAAPGMGDALVHAWRRHVAEVATEPGCLQYEMFRSVDDRDAIALVEHWASREAFETHWQRELNQPGGPGVAGTEALMVERDGLLFRTEIYEQRRHEFDGSAWVVASD